MLPSQLPNKSSYRLCLGPDALRDDVARRTVERATPRAIIVVVNPVAWNGVNLRVHRGQLLIKGLHRRMCSRMLHRALTKPDRELTGIGVTESLVRKPNSKVVADGVV
jgi:hypothetical protein